jgi:hypothetical protein
MAHRDLKRFAHSRSISLADRAVNMAVTVEIHTTPTSLSSVPNPEIKTGLHPRAHQQSLEGARHA